MERVFPFPAFPNGWFVVSYSDELAEELGRLREERLALRRAAQA